MEQKSLRQLFTEENMKHAGVLMREIGFAEGVIGLISKLTMAISEEDAFCKHFADECIHFHFAYLEFLTDTDNAELLCKAITSIKNKCSDLVDYGFTMRNQNEKCSVIFMFNDSYCINNIG